MRRRWLGGAALVSLSFVAAGCGSDGTAVPGSDASSTSSSLAIETTSSVGPTTTTAATQQYTVAGGDALYVIADRFCTTADAIVAANGWADGIAHPLYPGDAITIPGGGCTTGTTIAGPSDTGGEVDSTPDGGIVDPYDGDPGDYTDDYGPACDDAWGATWGLIELGYTAEQVLPTLEALPADVPADVVAAVHAAAAFNAEWYPVYVATTDRARAEHDYTDYQGYLDALAADPEYVEFFNAFLQIEDTARLPHEWSRSLCNDLLATEGSTP